MADIKHPKPKNIINMYNPDVFKTLLVGKTVSEATDVVRKYGYSLKVSLRDGVQRPNTWEKIPGNVYVEIRDTQIYKVIRIIPQSI